MPDFYQKVTEMQGGVETLVRKVPGFRGYFEKQDRRAADRLLRERLCRVFGGQLGEFTRLQGRLIDVGGLRYMERVKNIDSQLRIFLDKVESAAEGYAGLFDPIKIDEKVLASVYAFDNALFIYQDQLATGLKYLDEAIGSDAVDGVLDDLEHLVIEITSIFDQRGDVMRGGQDSV